MQIHTYGNKKKKILIVHGLLESHATYSRLAEDLQNEYTVCLVDLPGFGDSPATEERPILDGYARQVKQLINSEGFDLVVGHSLGGAVLIRALNDPELNYSKNVLLANAEYLGIPRLKPLAYFRGFNRLMLYLQCRLPLKFAGPIIKLAGRISAKNPDALTDQIIADCHRSDPDTSAILSYELAFDKFEWKTDRVLKSVTIIMSEFDEVVSNKNLEKLNEAIAGSRVVVFKGVGHMSVIEDYDTFLCEVKKAVNN